MTKTSPSFLNGIPELLILQLLARRERYGYELVQAIREESAAAFHFGEGCIYPYLHYLEETKLVSSRRETVEGRNRLYYRLTAKGQKRFAELSKQWERVAQGVTLVLGGAHA